jgi:hypothetical protein
MNQPLHTLVPPPRGCFSLPTAYCALFTADKPRTRRTGLRYNYNLARYCLLLSAYCLRFFPSPVFFN